MRAEDLPAVIALLAQWNIAPRSPNDTGVQPERDHIAIHNSYVAVTASGVVGIASFLPITERRAETASLAVSAQWLGRGVGHALQRHRLSEISRRGFSEVQTEADRPEVIDWYKQQFGYREIGRTAKRHAFGDSAVDHWTVLELRLPPTLQARVWRTSAR
jgi:N-acetylglutamate synthase-like GNAT family acetyltransferase